MKREFLLQKWQKNTLCNLIKHFDETGKIDCQKCIVDEMSVIVNIYAHYA